MAMAKVKATINRLIARELAPPVTLKSERPKWSLNTNSDPVKGEMLMKGSISKVV
jgi:hypothetical protein